MQGGSVTVECFSRHPESEIKTSVERSQPKGTNQSVVQFATSKPRSLWGSLQEDPQIPDFSCSLLKVYSSRSSMSHFETDETNQRPMS